MSWLQNILQVFRKDQELIFETINVSDFDAWLKRQENEIVIKFNLSDEIINYVKTIKAKRWELECKLDTWEKKSPKEENLQEIYKESRFLLDDLTFLEENSLLEILSKNDILEKKIEITVKLIESSSFIHDFSFLVEDSSVIVNPLLQELISLDSLRREFEQKMIKSGIKVLEKVNSKCSKINEYSKKINELNSNIKLKQNRVVRNLENKKEKQDLLDEFKQNKIYQEILDNKESKKKIESELEDKEDYVVIFFSRLKPTLIKYREMQPDKEFVIDYVNDPISALLNDESLMIIHVLNHLRAILQSGLADFDKSVISSLDKEKIEKIEQHYHKIINLKKKFNELNKFNENKDFQQKLEEVSYKLEHFNLQDEKLHKEINQLEEEINESMELRSKEKKMVQNLVKIGLNKELVINFV